MVRMLAAALLGALLLAGCGSGADATSDDDDVDAGPSASPSKSPSAAYFVRTDTDRINKVAEQARRGAVAATAQKRKDACDAAGGKGYAAWRRCWHALLDPFQRSLGKVAATMDDLATHDLPGRCRKELTRASGTFTARAEVVSGMLAGIDSDQRAAQERVMRTYDARLQKMGKAWSEPFVDLTQACYSPDDLASIEASASASPTS